MYEAGDFIVHPGQGVCRVDEVLESPQPTYMLMPVGGRHPGVPGSPRVFRLLEGLRMDMENVPLCV